MARAWSRIEGFALPCACAAATHEIKTSKTGSALVSFEFFGWWTGNMATAPSKISLPKQAAGLTVFQFLSDQKTFE
jgi:hypothetical protein